MVFKAEDRTRTKKQQADNAIQMALEGRWEEAAELNQAILASFPGDVDAYNRLGKAMTEQGRFGDAREAYMRALEIDSLNGIARKNLNRLSTLTEKKGKPKARANQKLSPEMFIEETGKTGVTALLRPDMEKANELSAGDEVKLSRDKKGNLSVQTLTGEHLGDIESRVGQRLVKFMDSGNEYVAAISGLSEDGVKIFIREKFQDAANTGKLSFPATIVSDPVRPYVKSRLVRSDADGALEYEEGDEPDEWSPRAAASDDDDADDEDETEDERGKIETDEEADE
ncbi:MAG TPA: tetratricopeptide repeat protein [Dehalococcoidia bacterium]|nr:tetratricopeptide repeat protein [Dehalococcoidia bacterium]